jgi:HEAT repeat protein
LADEILTQSIAAGPDQIDGLIRCLPGERFYFDKGAARAALVAIGEPAVPALVRALDSTDFTVSEGAAQTLGAMGPKARGAVPALEAILVKKDTPLMAQPLAAQALGKIGEIDFLIRIVEGQEAGIQRHLGAQGLGAAGPAAASGVAALIDMLNSADTATQMYAADALGQIGPAANAAVPRLTSSKGLRYLQIRQARLALSPYSERSIDSASSRSNAGPSASVAVSTSINTIPRQITAAGISTAGPRKR